MAMLRCGVVWSAWSDIYGLWGLVEAKELRGHDFGGRRDWEGGGGEASTVSMPR